MENISAPAPIKEYFIAYFDILGYKQFFKEQPEKANGFLAEINKAVSMTKKKLFESEDIAFLKSEKDNINFDFQIKIFWLSPKFSGN